MHLIWSIKIKDTNETNFLLDSIFQNNIFPKKSIGIIACGSAYLLLRFYHAAAQVTNARRNSFCNRFEFIACWVGRNKFKANIEGKNLAQRWSTLMSKSNAYQSCWNFSFSMNCKICNQNGRFSFIIANKQICSQNRKASTKHRTICILCSTV